MGYKLIEGTDLRITKAGKYSQLTKVRGVSGLRWIAVSTGRDVKEDLAEYFPKPKRKVKKSTAKDKE